MSIKPNSGDITEKKEEKPKAISEQKKTELPSAESRKMVGHEKQCMLEVTDQRIKELEERVMRLQAEFENYKKRAARENDFVRESAAADFILRLLPVVDEFGLALAHMDRGAHHDLKRGMELIFAKLTELLSKEGVEEMQALGERFDPYKHDALRQANGEEGMIVEVVQKGYLFRGKVLRHAKVAIGNGKAENAKEKQG